MAPAVLLLPSSSLSPQVRGSPFLRGSWTRRAGAAEGRRSPRLWQRPRRLAAGHVPCHRKSGDLPQQLRRSPLQVWFFLHETKACGEGSG